MRPSRNEKLISALGAEIKSRRTQLGLTQEDLAGAIELDRPYITMIESGRKQPTVSVFWRIAAGLGMSVGELAEAVEQRLRMRRRPAGKGRAPTSD